MAFILFSASIPGTGNRESTFSFDPSHIQHYNMMTYQQQQPPVADGQISFQAYPYTPGPSATAALASWQPQTAGLYPCQSYQATMPQQLPSLEDGSADVKPQIGGVLATSNSPLA